MNIVIIGGTGLIGQQLSAVLRQAGHQVKPASPSSGVNSLTGEGLDAVLAGAQVLVDVSNSPSFEDVAVLQFFRQSTQNLLAAGARAGVGHFVALSVVGSERLPASGYLRAKVAQEALIEAGPLPYSIVRATQFFEFLLPIAQAGTVGHTVRLPAASLQPIASADVAAALAQVAVAGPLKGRTEVGGPETAPFEVFIRRVLQARHDPREVVTDANATYFGTPLTGPALVAGVDARMGATSLAQWLDSGAAPR